MFNKIKKNAKKNTDPKMSRQERQHVNRVEKNKPKMQEARQRFVNELFDLGYHIVPRIYALPDRPHEARAVIQIEPVPYESWKQINEKMAEEEAKSPEDVVRAAQEKAKEVVQNDSVKVGEKGKM